MRLIEFKVELQQSLMFLQRKSNYQSEIVDENPETAKC